MTELIEYIKDHFGTCDRGADCFWGKDGCLRHMWLGRACIHWHPVEGPFLEALIKHSTIKEP